MTALIGACHFGELYVIHYLVAEGADPDRYDATKRNKRNEADINDVRGCSARTVPLSTLASHKYKAPISKTHVFGVIEAGNTHVELQ